MTGATIANMDIDKYTDTAGPIGGSADRLITSSADRLIDSSTESDEPVVVPDEPVSVSLTSSVIMGERKLKVGGRARVVIRVRETSAHPNLRQVTSVYV